MSVLGQKRTLRFASPMSALPPKADMVQHDRDVRSVRIRTFRTAKSSLKICVIPIVFADVRDPDSCPFAGASTHSRSLNKSASTFDLLDQS
jgi:hypothetical protein